MAQKITPKEFDQHFEYIKDIGSGSFGTVFQYQDKRTNLQWAIKKIECINFEQLSTSVQELTLLSRAVHKNVVQTRYYCMLKEEKKLPGGKIEDRYQLFLFMELARFSLDYEIKERYKQRHYYSPKSLFYIIYDLTSALAYLQNIKLSHRDIKPHNILKIEDSYKLTDFGVSKPNLEATKVNTLIGSPPYLSPQLYENYQKGLQNVENNSFKSDCFSLGLVILGCALLKDISGCNNNENLKNQKLQELKDSKRYGIWLSFILDGLLQFKEEQRWDFIDLKNQLQIIQQNQEQFEFSLKKNCNSPNSERVQGIEQKQIQELINLKSLNIENFSECSKQTLKRMDSLQIQTEEEIKEDNVVVTINDKFMVPDEVDDEDEADQIDSMTIGKIFSQKKEKFNQKKSIQFPEGNYSGDLNSKNQRHGNGEFLSLKNDFYYIGQWQNDVMQGEGEGYWEHGKIYNGQWEDSRRSGKGKQIYPNGDIYEGEFKIDAKHGKGIYTSQSEKYQGEFQYGDKCGYGIYEYSDGTIYEGNWKNNEKEGKGIYKKTDGKIIYEGTFKKSKYNGKGKLYMIKKVYEGEFKNNLQHGEGIIYKIKNKEKQYKCVYEKGKLISEEKDN